jgi:uncharacterized protein YdeI (YjbR/CyaY-like superfamily)
MNMEDQILFPTREVFRQWLTENHGSSKGIWLVFRKSGKIKCVKPDEALEEALCFGWIDGQIQSVDDAKYLKKFTPRRKGSKWSERNKEIVNRLIKEEKVVECGLKAIAQAKTSGDWNAPGRMIVTQEQIDILIKDINGAEPALTNFLKMPFSTRQTYTGFYLSAKKEETRLNRVKKIIEALNKNNKSPMF